MPDLSPGFLRRCPEEIRDSTSKQARTDFAPVLLLFVLMSSGGAGTVPGGGRPGVRPGSSRSLCCAPTVVCGSRARSAVLRMFALTDPHYTRAEAVS